MTWIFYIDPELGCCFKAISQILYGYSAYLAAGPGVGNSIHTGTWRVKIYRNDIEVAQDCFTLVEGGFADRDQAKTDLDERWSALTQAERESIVSDRYTFNEFLNMSSHVSSREINPAIIKAKTQYPKYENIDPKLITSIISYESYPIGNYFSISKTGALGLGQEIFYIDVNKSKNEDQTPPIYAHEMYAILKNSDKSDADMHTFKTETFRDNRTLVVESIAIMFAHLTELMNIDYIGKDTKKILAGYKWGQGFLKDWLDICQAKNVDWYENLDKDIGGAIIDPQRVATKTYIVRVLSYYK